MVRQRMNYDWRKCSHACKSITYIIKSNDEDGYIFIDRWDREIKKFKYYHDALWYAEENLHLINRSIDIQDLSQNIYNAVTDFIKFNSYESCTLTMEEELILFNSINRSIYDLESFSEACFNEKISEESVCQFKNLKFALEVENRFRLDYKFNK